METIFTERELIQKFKEAKTKKKEAEAALANAEADYNYFEFMILERCEALGTTKTGEYSDIGHVTIMKPRIYASCAVNDQRVLFDRVRAAGRSDLIKETIAPAALSGYVGELIDEIGSKIDLSEEDREKKREVLRSVSYHLQPKAKLYDPPKRKAAKASQGAVTLEVE